MSSLPKSSNLVNFIGYSESPCCIIMKFYHTSLKNVYRELPDTLAMKSKIALDVANGMCVLHEIGIIHLDLKLRKRGTSFIFQLSDPFTFR